MATDHIRLQGVGPQLAGLRWEFQDRFRIGRDQTLELCLEDRSVQRLHAEVMPTPGGWMIRNLANTPATLVNGVRIERTARKLQSEDVLQCGNVVLKVESVQQDLQLPRVRKKIQPRVKTTGAFVTIQAAVQRSWEQGLEALAQHNDDRLQQGKHFLTLLRAGYYLSRVTSLDDMLEAVLDDIVAVLNAQRGSFLLVDETTRQLQPRRTAPARPGSDRAGFSKTLAQRCFNQGESLLCQDVNADADLMQSREIKLGSMGSVICALLRSPRRKLGVLHLDRGPLEEPFSQEDFHLADAIAAGLSVGIESAQLVEQQRDQVLQEAGNLVQRLVRTVDPVTAGHHQRVAAHARLLAETLNLSAEECAQVERGALLHDVGLLALPESLRHRFGPLSPDELEEYKGHVTEGASLVGTITDLDPILPIIRNHHEHWDGSGYPDGLSGEGIPQSARIVAVADAFDEMVSGQPQPSVLSAEQAFEELKKRAGSQLDPACVQGFLALRPQIEEQLSPRLTASSDIR